MSDTPAPKTDDKIGDETSDKPLPGDHGQFGVDNATEDYKRLKDSPKPAPNPAEVNKPG